MLRTITLFFVFLQISHNCFSQLNLKIEIIEIRSDKGNIMLQLFDENEKLLNLEMSPVKDNSCSFLIPDLKPGKYAVRYYHDENLNGKMEKNLFGKPTEGYGFSNNVIGKSGPPPFDKWLFELYSDKKIILKPMY